MSRVKILMGKYELGKILGIGNFATVQYARNIDTDQVVAIKVIDKDMILEKGLDLQMKREIKIMGMLRHRNIVQIYEVLATKSKIYIVLEYAEHGNLCTKVNSGRLKEDEARWIFQQLISTMGFCHSRGVYHRDLKLENLLLDKDENLKVSDFGLSRCEPEVEGKEAILHTRCGTVTYIAPEVIYHRGYSGSSADIWSCGVILYAMLAGYLPFRGSNLEEVTSKIKRCEYKCPSWFPPEVRKLLAKIFELSPKKRITIPKIMENPWFRRELGSLRTRLGNSASANTILQDPRMLIGMNAFDMISLSPGFDLSGLFVNDEQKVHARFISKQSAYAIVSKMEEIAVELKLKVLTNDGMFLRLSRIDEEGSHDLMTLDVEVSEFTESFYLVELKKSSGDSFDYRKLMKDMRPAVGDVVWAWQENQIFSSAQLVL